MSETWVEFSGPTPHLAVSDPDRAIQFYRDVFAADELLRNHAPDGRIMHCELLVCGGRLLLTDDFDSDPVSAPTRLGGTTVRLHLQQPDAAAVDATYRRALDAGATALLEPMDAFWGERYAMLRDPFGHVWSLGAGHEELSVAELEHRADTWSTGPTP